MNLSFLFIVNSFPPLYDQNSLRALEISRILFKEGLRPLILTRREIKKEPKDFSLLKRIPKGLEIYKTQVIDSKRRYSLKSLFFKITSKIVDTYFFLHWIPFAYVSGIKLLKTRKDINFIYSTGPPFYPHVIAYLLKKHTNLPLVIEYRDPWNFNPYTIKKKNITHRIQLKLERKILDSSDVIITISPALRKFLINKFPNIKNKRIFSIANGLNIVSSPSSTEIKKKSITFTFIGSLYGKRDITPLLNILASLKQEKLFNDLKFTLKIFGRYDKEYLNKKIHELGIQDLILLGGYLRRSQLFKEIEVSTLTVHIGENVNYPTISFKVWDYLSRRKKILYLGLENSYTADFLIKEDFGIVIPINNLEKGLTILKTLISDIGKGTFLTTFDESKLVEYTWDSRVKKLKEHFENNIPLT